MAHKSLSFVFYQSQSVWVLAFINTSFSYVLGSLCKCGFECVNLQPQERKQERVKSRLEGEWAASQADLRQLCSAAQKVMCHGIFCFVQHKEASTKRGTQRQRPALAWWSSASLSFSPSPLWQASNLRLPSPCSAVSLWALEETVMRSLHNRFVQDFSVSTRTVGTIGEVGSVTGLPLVLM